MNSTKSVLVNAEELRDAFEWVSAAAPFENGAYIRKDDGRIYWTSDVNDVFEEPPEDVEDPELYISVPHKNDLNLGRKLALMFMEQELPDDFYDVAEFFRHKGAYARFKGLLEQRDMLERWYEFEENMTKWALQEWCEANSIQLIDPSGL